MNELLSKSAELSDVVKDIDPNTEIFGPVLWGYPDYRNLNDSTDYATQCVGYATFVECYLDKMKQAAIQTNHTRLLDVFDIHWYPELFILIGSDWFKIVKDGGSSNTLDFQIARMQAPRALWDSLTNYQTFVQNPNNHTITWVFDAGHGPTFFPLIPKLQTSIQTYYPNTKLSFSEFSPGGENNISGGIATADILGTFGKQNVYFASFWQTEGWTQGQEYIPAAYKLYRNYNGQNGTFGSTAVDVQSSDAPDSRGILNSAVYASIEGTNEHGDENRRNVASTGGRTGTPSSTQSSRV